MSSLNQCTYDVTGPSNVLQFYRICYTCSENHPYNIPVCLNCASLCHEDHHLGPVMKDAFFCRCYENDVHFCRASRAAQCHILRRRAQDSNFKSMQKEYLVDQTPYPMKGSLLGKKLNSSKQDKQSTSKNDNKFVIWYRVDQQPKAIVKVCDDVDEANDCVKSAFVDYNPWDMSSLELRCLDTFQSTYSATGLAHYSVSLSTKANNQQKSAVVVSPVDIAKETSSLETETASLSPSVSVSNQDRVDQRLLKDDPTLAAKGNHWEVCAETLDNFLQDYGCESAPALLSVTPSTHQPVEWYSFPEHDPFDPELNSKVNPIPTPGKRNTKKKTASDTATSSSSPQILYGYQHDLKKTSSNGKKHVNYADTTSEEKHSTKNVGGKKKTTKESSSSEHRTSSKGKGPVPPRTVPAVGITEEDFDYDAALPSLTGRKRARKSRFTKEDEKEDDNIDAGLDKTEDATPSKTKKTRAPKEAGAPKGPVSSFMYYTMEQRPHVRTEFPHLSVTEITRRMGESWRKLTAEEKEPFETLARLERERYNKEMMDFKASKQEKEATHEQQETNEKTSDVLDDVDDSLLQSQSQIPAVQEIETAAADEESISDDEDDEDEEEEEEEGDEVVDKIEKNVVYQGQPHDTSTVTETEEQEEGNEDEEEQSIRSASDILDSSQEETDLEMMEQPEAKRPRLE